VSTPDDPTTSGLPDGLPQDASNLDAVSPLAASGLSPQDDAFVAGLLSADGLADPLPADVATRWDAMITAESAQRAEQSADAAAIAAGAAPLASINAGHRAKKSPMRRFRLAGAAASVAAIALVGGIVANAVLAEDPVAGTNPDVVSAASSPLPIATNVSTSGITYQPNGILSQVGGLLKGVPFQAGSGPAPTAITLPPTDEAASTSTGESSGVEGLPATSSDGTATLNDAPDPTLKTGTTTQTAPKAGTSDPAPAAIDLSKDPVAVAFRTNEQRRTDCLDELNSGPGARPVLLDLGYFNREPAALIVLPTSGDAQRLDIWIVGPDCTKGDAHVLWFGRVSRP